jgi:hypothetical protein
LGGVAFWLACDGCIFESINRPGQKLVRDPNFDESWDEGEGDILAVHLQPELAQHHWDTLMARYPNLQSALACP